MAAATRETVLFPTLTWPSSDVHLPPPKRGGVLTEPIFCDVSSFFVRDGETFPRERESDESNKSPLMSSYSLHLKGLKKELLANGCAFVLPICTVILGAQLERGIMGSRKKEGGVCDEEAEVELGILLTRVGPRFFKPRWLDSRPPPPPPSTPTSDRPPPPPPSRLPDPLQPIGQ